MATQKITYATKEQGQVSTAPIIQQWRWQDGNEVKDVVNTNASQTQENADNLTVLNDAITPLEQADATLTSSIPITNTNTIIGLTPGTITDPLKLNIAANNVDVLVTGKFIMAFSVQLIDPDDDADTVRINRVEDGTNTVLDTWEFPLDSAGTFDFTKALVVEYATPGTFRFEVLSIGGNEDVSLSVFNYTIGQLGDAFDKAENDAALASKLDLAGGTMTGSILGDQLIRGYRQRSSSEITGNTLLSALNPNIFHRVNTSSNTITITVDDLSNTNFADGTEFEFFVVDATNVFDFVVSGSQSIISLNDSLSMSEKGTACVLKKIDTNTWALIGGLD